MRGTRNEGSDEPKRRRLVAALGLAGVSILGGCADRGASSTDSDSTRPSPTGSPAGTREGTATASPSLNRPTTAPEGFRSLFDGEDLSGWHQVNGQATYTVEDGAIVGTATPEGPNSFLSTQQVFDDFVLEFEVKVDRGLNSGVQFRSNTRQAKRHLHGPQVEIEDSPGENGYIYGEATGNGWLSGGGSNPPSNEVLRNDEWNQYRVRAEGSVIETWINGEAIERLDVSAFDLLPMGVIGLQVHSVGQGKAGLQVRWRNVRIRELDAAAWIRLDGRSAWSNPFDHGRVSRSDGDLVLRSGQPFFLRSTTDADDFLFETWVKADAPGGILVRNGEGSRPTGYRAEIDPTEGGRSGSLYDASEETWLVDVQGQDHAQMAFQAGRWNYYRVMAQDRTLRVWVNGIVTAEASVDPSAGAFGLQHRGGEGAIRFRDLAYEPLGRDEK